MFAPFLRPRQNWKKGLIVIRPKMLGRVENGTNNPHLEKGNYCKQVP